MIVACAVLAHVSTTRPGHETQGALLAIAPVALFALLLAWRVRRAWGLALWLLAAAVAAAYWGELRSHFVWLYFAQQVALYGLLGLAFGRTLAHGFVPLCTQMALHAHGALGESALRYTRRVTQVWTAFFLVTAVALVVLFFAAPLRVWSACANFGAPLAIVVVFATEHVVRYRALPHMQHAGLLATIRASIAVGLGGSRAAGSGGSKLRKELARRAAGRYRRSGIGAYWFARCKLGFDPFYSVLLSEGLIPSGARIVDLGCAQGLLAAWLLTARQSFVEGAWDGACPEPASVEHYRGVDRNAAEIRRARIALGEQAEFAVGDMTGEPLSGATLVVLLDVLHYVDFASQVELLRRIRSALPSRGVLLLRVGDSDGSLRSRISLWVDRAVIRMRGGGRRALSRRGIGEWTSLLEGLGFNVHEVARQRSPAYVNCLLRALPRPA